MELSEKYWDLSEEFERWTIKQGFGAAAFDFRVFLDFLEEHEYIIIPKP